MTNKLTDAEIVKALEWHINEETHCSPCPYEEHSVTHSCVEMLIADTLDLINRLQAENTELLGKIEGLEANRVELLENIEQLESVITQIKAEAYKEFYEELHTEILKARDSNFKAKEERIAKSKEYGIPIDVDDNFLMYCDGKIHALDGIDYFAYETLKEMESENNA